jgi:hypothetical protein
VGSRTRRKLASSPELWIPAFARTTKGKCAVPRDGQKHSVALADVLAQARESHSDPWIPAFARMTKRSALWPRDGQKTFRRPRERWGEACRSNWNVWIPASAKMTNHEEFRRPRGGGGPSMRSATAALSESGCSGRLWGWTHFPSSGAPSRSSTIQAATLPVATGWRRTEFARARAARSS